MSKGIDPGRAGRVVSLEPEYERLHRKMHAQLREIYRRNGGAPISDAEFLEVRRRHELQVMMSWDVRHWIMPEPIHYDTNGYEYGKKAAVVIPESQGKTLQQT